VEIEKMRRSRKLQITMPKITNPMSFMDPCNHAISFPIPPSPHYPNATTDSAPWSPKAEIKNEEE